MVIHLGPDFLDAERITADEHARAQILDHAGRGGAADPVGDGGFSDAADAFVGKHLDDDRVQLSARDEINVDARDLHGWFLAVAAVSVRPPVADPYPLA
jgi:hypothetical protein